MRRGFDPERRLPDDVICESCNGRGWHGMMNSREASCYECSGSGRVPIPNAEIFPEYAAQIAAEEEQHRLAMREAMHQWAKKDKGWGKT